MKIEKYFKNLFGALGISSTLLIGGCSYINDIIYVGSTEASELTLDKNYDLNGSISYKNLEKGYVRIITLKYNDKILEPKLMVIYHNLYRPIRMKGYDTIEFFDIESKMVLLAYFYPNYYSEEEIPEITRGEEFTILENVSMFDFLVDEGWFQEEYDINELIEFYNEKVKPNFETIEEDEIALYYKK